MNAWQWVASQPWLMTEGALAGILAFADRVPLTTEMVEALHAGEAEAVAAKVGQEMDGTRSVTVRDGVATIPVRGPISRYASFFSNYSGGTSVASLARDFQSALESPSVRAILLDVNSPGGSADGIGELAGMIHQARGKKPIAAYVGNLGASAAYWLASAADEIVVAPTGTVGSIGVVCSVAPKRTGKDAPMEFVSTQSPRKRLDPAEAEGRADLQAQLDTLADVFLADVARFRGTSPERVQADYGQGGVKIGKAAVEAGMADRLGSYESLHSELARGVRSTGKGSSNATAAATARSQTKDVKMPFSWKNLFMKAVAGIPDDGADADASSNDSDLGHYLASLQSGGLQPARLKVHRADDADIQTAVEAARAEERETHRKNLRGAFQAQGEAFVLGEVKAGRVLPADAQRLAFLYADFAMADQESPIKATVNGQEVTYSRLSHFTAEIGQHGKHKLTEETLPAEASELPSFLKGLNLKALPNANVEPKDSKKADAESVLELLRATGEGRSILADLAANRK